MWPLRHVHALVTDEGRQPPGSPLLLPFHAPIQKLAGTEDGVQDVQRRVPRTRQERDQVAVAELIAEHGRFLQALGYGRYQARILALEDLIYAPSDFSISAPQGVPRGSDGAPDGLAHGAGGGGPGRARGALQDDGPEEVGAGRHQELRGLVVALLDRVLQRARTWVSAVVHQRARARPQEDHHHVVVPGVGRCMQWSVAQRVVVLALTTLLNVTLALNQHFQHFRLVEIGSLPHQRSAVGPLRVQVRTHV
mmetsp:Transcript_23410/g.66751  ORF Transcript_23410/g.66751 Transcript_23410/m.66751 type:complete len:251 (+) Transcript_23410:1400-2152(+)